MNGSGKQILLSVLTELSTRLTPERDLPRATRRLRAGLLAHGSTAEESYECCSRVSWASEQESDGNVSLQSMAIGDSLVSLTDIYDTVFEMEGLKEFVLAKHPNLKPVDFAAFEWVIWLLVSSVRMVPTLLSSEQGEPTVDEWEQAISKHYDNYFAEKQH